MTYIPNTRDAIENIPFSKRKEPNPYYEGILKDEDKKEMDFYDHGVQDCANAMDNFDVAFGLAENILEDEIPEGQDFHFSEEEEEFLMSDKVTRFIKIAILAYVELQRDEMVIGKIDCYANTPEEKKHFDRFNKMEEDYKNLSEEEFYKKYPLREYDEYGQYKEE